MQGIAAQLLSYRLFLRVSSFLQLAAFFLVDRVRDVCAVVPVLEQWVFLFEMVSGIVFLALALRSEQLLTDAGDQAAFGWRRLIAWILWAQLSILVAAVFTGALGDMRLARLLGGAVLTSSYVALVLYAGVPVGEGLVAYVLRAGPLRQLLMVQRHRALLQRRIDLALRWLSIVTWVYLTLDGLGVMDSIWSAGTMALGARYSRGSVSLSLADVVAFGLTVWAAFLLSSFVRFVLGEDVYPRVGLPRGVPYAVSTLTHYAIVLAGFVFGYAAPGPWALSPVLMPILIGLYTGATAGFDGEVLLDIIVGVIVTVVGALLGRALGYRLEGDQAAGSPP